MHHPKKDRRRNNGEFRVEPPRSPANLLILTVTGALLASAAATALVDGGALKDGTPHGELLSALRTVANEQADHHAQNGHFARWLHTLDVPQPEGVELILLGGNRERWEALARHPIGLTCSQMGGVENGRATLDQPVCFTTPPEE